MLPSVLSLDHLVLTVADIEKTVAFYRDVLGMTPQKFTPADGTTRWALTFGSQKINLHQSGAEFDPKAAHPKSGSADLCFLSEISLADWAAHLRKHGVSIIEGPVPRTGATSSLLSLYLRDPDGNLLEISNKSNG